MPDPSCNPYLAFAAMLMAGVDGVRHRIEPPVPIDKDLYELSPDELAGVGRVPGRSARCWMRCRRIANTSPTGDVFTPDLIQTWIGYKRANELDPQHLRPTPHELELYFDG